MRYTTIADNLVGELGRIGQKVGKGWYDYDPSKGKGRLPIVSPEVADFVNKHRLKVGIASGGVSLRASLLEDENTFAMDLAKWLQT